MSKSSRWCGRARWTVSVTDREIAAAQPARFPAQQPDAADKVRSLVASPGVAAFTPPHPGSSSALDQGARAGQVEFSGRVESTFWRDFSSVIVPLAYGRLWMLSCGAWAAVDQRCPSAAQGQTYDRRAQDDLRRRRGVDEAKTELSRRGLPKNPKYQRSAPHPQGRVWSEPRDGQDLMAGGRGRSRRPFFLPLGIDSWRCSSASARRGCAISSSRQGESAVHRLHRRARRHRQARAGPRASRRPREREQRSTSAGRVDG